MLHFIKIHSYIVYLTQSLKTINWNLSFSNYKGNAPRQRGATGHENVNHKQIYPVCFFGISVMTVLGESRATRGGEGVPPGNAAIRMQVCLLEPPSPAHLHPAGTQPRSFLLSRLFTILSRTLNLYVRLKGYQHNSFQFVVWEIKDHNFQ